MKNTVILLFLCFMGSSLLAQDNLLGTWDTGNQNSLIEIYQGNQGYAGKVVSSDNPEAKVGMPIIKDLKCKDGKWTAKLYALKRKECYDAEMVVNDERLKITVSVGFFSKTINWSRTSG